MLHDDDDEKVLAMLYSGIIYNNARFRHKLHRNALLHPLLSPWQRIYDHADDSSFLDATGLTRDAFEQLLLILFPESDQLKRGRSYILPNHAALAIYLFYLGSKMHYKHLCMIFGVTPSTVSNYINRMLKLVVRKLKRNNLAKISFPNRLEMENYAHMVNQREPSVDNIIGFVDGFSTPIECNDEIIEQSNEYNGYHHDTMCQNVFAFAPTGKIIHASIDFPGFFHDSQVAMDLIDVVIRKIGTYAMCVDQGFPRSGDLFDKFVGPCSKKQE
jgi:hypothetical protein